ncbi:MAG: hypothetical protein WAL73_03585, partial [Terracidiphilus sp.]
MAIERGARLRPLLRALVGLALLSMGVSAVAERTGLAEADAALQAGRADATMAILRGLPTPETNS